MKKSISYEKSGVSYKTMDPVKKIAQKLAKETSKNLKINNEKEVGKSRGESAYVWDCKDHFRAFVVEGLGTKNLVADKMEEITGKSYYKAIAQDTVAAIVNDLITVGASPEVINAYWAIGDSKWLKNKTRINDLILGWKIACDLAGATWGGGETPTYPGIINPKTIDLGGAATGIIRPKSRLVLGDHLKEGDRIVFIESSGIHANGLTLVRKIANKLERGFKSKLPSGKLLGEAILIPSIIYAKLIQSLIQEKVVIHYMVNVTGHGWKKIMRHPKKLTYIIESIPPISEEFSFIQEKSGLSDKEMYGTFNMGSGFVIFIEKKQFPKVKQIANSHKLKVYNAGYVKVGPRQVVIEPKNIVFKSETLDLR